MANPSTLSLLLLALTTLLSPTHAVFSQPISREVLGLKANEADNNLTQLTFYFHDVVSGSNPTTVTIAKAKTASASFGSLAMMDDPLTDGPDAMKSKLVGRAQGMYALADQSETAPIMIMNLLFLEGQYNGSTLSVLGRNPVNQGVREMPVVGGTGVFRFAKGYAQAKTYTFDKTTGNAVVEYTVFVSHASGSTAPGSGGGSDSGSGSDGGSGSPGSTPSNRASSSSSLGLGFLMSSSVASLFLVHLLSLA